MSNNKKKKKRFILGSLDGSLEETLSENLGDLSFTYNTDVPITKAKRGEYELDAYEEHSFLWELPPDMYDSEVQLESVSLLGGFNVDYRNVEIVGRPKIQNPYLSRSGTVLIFKGSWMEEEGLHDVCIKLMNVKEDVELKDFESASEVIEKAKMLDHPGVLKVHGALFFPGKVGTVTQFCPYGDLHMFLRRHPWLGMAERARMALEILEAMIYLQKKNFSVDLRMSNILVDENMHIKVIPIGAQSFPGLLSCDNPIKTLVFDAPALLVSEEVYRYGICFYALFSKITFPFVENNHQKDVYRVYFRLDKLPHPWVRDLTVSILGKPKKQVTFQKVFKIFREKIIKDVHIGGLAELAKRLLAQEEEDNGVVIYVREPEQSEDKAEDLFLPSKNMEDLHNVLKKWRSGYVIEQIFARIGDVNSELFPLVTDKDVLKLENDCLIVAKVKKKYKGFLIYLREEEQGDSDAEDFLLEIATFENLKALGKKKWSTEDVEQFYVINDGRNVVVDSDKSLLENVEEDTCIVARFKSKECGNKEIIENENDVPSEEHGKLKEIEVGGKPLGKSNAIVEKKEEVVKGVVVYIRTNTQKDSETENVYLEEKTLNCLSKVISKTMKSGGAKASFYYSNEIIDSDEKVELLEDDSMVVVCFGESVSNDVPKASEEPKVDGIVIYIRTDDQQESEAENFYLKEKNFKGLVKLIMSKWKNKKIEKIFLNKERSIFYQVQNDADVFSFVDDSQIIVKFQEDEDLFGSVATPLVMKDSKSETQVKFMLKRKTFESLELIVKKEWKGFGLSKVFFRFNNGDLKRIKTDADVRNLKENSTLIVRLKKLSKKDMLETIKKDAEWL